MSDIVKFKNKDVMDKTSKAISKKWQWRTSRGIYIYPREMETRHLFFSLRMIWNHTMPEEAHIPEGMRYSHFGPYYTEEYLKQAVKELSSELSKRNDMTPDWKRQLQSMIDKLKRYHLEFKND